VSGAVVDYGAHLPEIPGRLPWEAPTQHLIRTGDGYEIADGRRPSKTLLVNPLREAVGTWRDARYPGASDVTRDLFRFWFDEDHLLSDGRQFRYHFGQREAVETLAFLVEIERITDIRPLIEKFGEAHEGGHLIPAGIQFQEATDGRRSIVRYFPELASEGTQPLPAEGLLRYALKMATGSGKTVVMALIVAWSWFHRSRIGDSPLSRHFLIVAPNVIVYERLAKDFASNRIFEELPIVPPGWSLDLKPILRGESAEPSPTGTLFLTNIQQIHESREKEWTPEDAVQALLGQPVAKDLSSRERSMLERIRSLPDLIAINDEAHHVHDDDLQWAKTLESLGDRLRLWLDFSATPKTQSGTYFPWIVCDYPLSQAVEDGIVKVPLIVQRVTRADPEKVTADNVIDAYGEWLQAAVMRWREHTEAYGKAGVAPVLFIMAEKSDYADRIGEWLRKTKEFGFREEEILVIHTDAGGDIRKGELEGLRSLAAAIDSPESPIKIIVSVLMLREGWDVQSVTVVLGLRPFTAKAQILPEQAVGRGLRLMPNLEGTQTLEVMGTRAFEEFVQGLDTEGLGVPITKTPPVLPVTIEPLRTRTEYDIVIPITQPLLGRSYRKLSEIDPASIGGFGDPPDSEEVRFAVEHLTTGTHIGEITFGYPVLPGEVAVGRLVDSVADKAKLSGQFAVLYPIVEAYVRHHLFGQTVELDDDNVAGLLSNFAYRERLGTHIASRVGEATLEERPLEFDEQDFRLSQVGRFLWRRPHFQATHTIFNFVTVYNNYELRFAEWLDSRPDIPKWAALAEQFTRFNVTYLGPSGALRRYYPDFVAVQTTSAGDVNWVIETKGRVFADVEYKDRGIRAWCHAIREQAGQDWRYMRVDQLVFDKGKYASFDNLIAAVASARTVAPGLGLIVEDEEVERSPAVQPLFDELSSLMTAAGWLIEELPLEGVVAFRAVDPEDAGRVIVPLDGLRRTSAAEVSEVARLREAADDEWPWIVVSRAGFSADARATAEAAGLRPMSAAELVGGLDRPDASSSS
jgi:type III restriction enzyme